MDNRVVVTFNMVKRNISVDIDIPTDITARDLVKALNTAYKLEINTDDIKQCYIQMENPIALLRGNNLISESGIRNGSVLYYTE